MSRSSSSGLVTNMVDDVISAEVRSVEDAQPLVNIGDIVKHPKYGIGLVISTSRIPGFLSRGSLHDPRIVATVSVLWADGGIDEGWPVARLAKFVCTSRGLHI